MKKTNQNDHKSIDRIYRHIEKDYNIKGTLKSVLNGNQIMPQDLVGTILYQESFCGANWLNCDLTNASGNGTIFKKNDFNKSKINNVSFQYCSFSDDIFSNCDFKGSNFANSDFVYCAINNSVIYGCSFLGASFYSGIIKDTEIQSSNFELCCFRRTLFKNVDLRQLTLNYCFFDEVKMDNVCLPFLQIPYTFNGLQYVFNTDDKITISSHSKSQKHLSVNEYKKMIYDFVAFFESQRQYFPLVNCYLVLNKKDLAISRNKTGILKSSTNHDFRSLYFYCIQASQILKLSHNERVSLYSDINKVFTDSILTGAEHHQFCIYYPKIKKLLFDVPHNNPVMTLTVKTNIEPDDYDNLSLLLEALETISSSQGISLDSKHIEIRHNSPNIIDFFTSGQFEHLINVLKNFYNVAIPIINDISDIITVGGVVIASAKFITNKIKNSNHPKNSSNKKKKRIKSNNEINELREEINCQRLHNEQYRNELNIINTNIEEETLNNLIHIKEKLKESGIQITGLEVQFLNTDDDLLDQLYHRKIE